MEISTPSHRSRSILPCLNISVMKPYISPKIPNNLAPNPPIEIRLPLNRPEYKPPQPIRIKPPITTKRLIPRPISTTSDVLRLMDSLNLPVTLEIYVLLIKECTKLGDPVESIELYKHIRRTRVPIDLTVRNRILLMFVCSGCFEHARQLFEQMRVRDFNSWAIVIASSVEIGDYLESVKLFTRMLCIQKFDNASIDLMEISVSRIVLCVLKACSYSSDFDLATQVHCWLLKMGYSRNVALSSFLISLYGKMDCFQGAQSVFEHVNCRNTAVWTSRLVNFCNNGDFEGVIRIFNEMGKEGVRKNGYTVSTVLKACGRANAIDCGRQVHTCVVKLGLESNDYVQCALVDLYGKCGSFNEAARLFDGERRNIACFNAMLGNYIQHGLCIEALRFLWEMKMAGFYPPESLLNELKLICGGTRIVECM